MKGGRMEQLYTINEAIGLINNARGFAWTWRELFKTAYLYNDIGLMCYVEDIPVIKEVISEDDYREEVEYFTGYFNPLDTEEGRNYIGKLSRGLKVTKGITSFEGTKDGGVYNYYVIAKGALNLDPNILNGEIRPSVDEFYVDKADSTYFENEKLSSVTARGVSVARGKIKHCHKHIVEADFQDTSSLTLLKDVASDLGCHSDFNKFIESKEFATAVRKGVELYVHLQETVTKEKPLSFDKIEKHQYIFDGYYRLDYLGNSGRAEAKDYLKRIQVEPIYTGLGVFSKQGTHHHVQFGLKSSSDKDWKKANGSVYYSSELVKAPNDTWVAGAKDKLYIKSEYVSCVLGDVPYPSELNINLHN